MIQLLVFKALGREEKVSHEERFVWCEWSLRAWFERTTRAFTKIIFIQGQMDETLFVSTI